MLDLSERTDSMPLFKRRAMDGCHFEAMVLVVDGLGPSSAIHARREGRSRVLSTQTPDLRSTYLVVGSSAIAVIGPIVGEGQLLVPLRSLEHPLRRTTAVLLPEDSTRP